MRQAVKEQEVVVVVGCAEPRSGGAHPMGESSEVGGGVEVDCSVQGSVKAAAPADEGRGKAEEHGLAAGKAPL